MRGQISLDFILAITIALVAAGAILAVSGQIAQTQAQSSARQQLNGIGNSLAAVISYSGLLNEAGSSASITFDIPALLIAGSAKPEPCTITIDTINGTIVLQEMEDLEIDPENLEGGYFSSGNASGWLVYDREKEECYNCTKPIVRVKQGGRSTYFCSRCQRK